MFVLFQKGPSYSSVNQRRVIFDQSSNAKSHVFFQLCYMMICHGNKSLSCHLKNCFYGKLKPLVVYLLNFVNCKTCQFDAFY